jgi:hypothetical protein
MYKADDPKANRQRIDKLRAQDFKKQKKKGGIWPAGIQTHYIDRAVSDLLSLSSS